MIQLLSIEFNDKADEMQLFFDAKCGIVEENGVEIDYIPLQCKQKNVLSNGCCCFFSYNNQKYDQNKIRDLLTFILSDKLADYIISKYEEKLLSRVINTNYCYFNALEKKSIIVRTRKLLEDEGLQYKCNIFQIKRKNLISKKLNEYLRNNNELIIEGFVNFRLNEYFRYLEDAVDRSVDEYMVEKEYKEFILLLRYFVDVQEPKYDVVNIFPIINNRYILFDNKNNEITSECTKEFLDELNQGDINDDDLLVSTLITIAPKKIVVHSVNRFNNKGLLETIKNVFCGKYDICNNCTDCLNGMKILSEHKVEAKPRK